MTAPPTNENGKHQVRFAVDFPSYFTMTELVDVAGQMVSELEKMSTNRNGGRAIFHRVTEMEIDRA